MYCPYHAAKFEKNPYSTTWDINLLNFWPQIADLAQKRVCLQIWLAWFFSTCCPYHATKFIYSGSWDISIHNFGPQLGETCPFDTKEDILGNLTWAIFIHFLLSIMLQSLKKILRMAYPCSFYFHALMLVVFWKLKLPPLYDTGKDKKLITDFEKILTFSLARGVWLLVLSLGVTAPLITS